MIQRPPIVAAVLAHLLLLCSILAPSNLSVQAQTAAPPPTAPLSFERDVRPILKAHCFHCHGEGEKNEANLDMRLKRFLEKGGESGPALVAGDIQKSLLLKRLRSGEMPPGEKKLTPVEIDKIEKWIVGGAPTLRPEPEKLTADTIFTEEERSYWAFQPIASPAPPTVKESKLVRNPIDAFLLARLEAKGVSFNPEADKNTLIRRAYFDLLGLPPPVAEVESFLADTSPDAYERLIDRLLASPQYAEHWARHWLDVAGYADSDGYTEDDPVRPYAYKYRDYVIRSLDGDKPWNFFLQEQLAGDELIAGPHANLAPEQIEKLIATGFLRTAPDGTAGGANQTEARNQVVAETVKIVSSSLLGMTVGCAQCHNHRYDPISQEDYYRLRAIFEPALDWKNWRAPPARRISLYTDADRAKSAQVEQEAVKIDQEREKKQTEFINAQLEKEYAKLPEPIREPARAARNAPADKRTPEQTKLLKDYPSLNISAGSLYLYDQKAADELKKMAESAAAVRGKKPIEDFLSVLTEVPGQIPPTFLFQRGDPDVPKQQVTPADLRIVHQNNESAIPVDDPNLPTSGRRLAFAKQLTSGKHPLLARVLVNRFWMHHFGKGIVETPADFGFLGSRPTHPELLDFLASDFTAGGWKLKRFHKLLMTSTAYRQTSLRTPAKEAADPEDVLVGRMPIRRLQSETVRDAMLALSGKLNLKMYGPPVPVMEDEDGQIVVGIENLNGENRPGAVIPLNGEEFRRSLYVIVRRSKPLSVLETFDAPRMEPNCEIRNVSTVAPQALFMMNGDFSRELAGLFAQRLLSEADSDPALQVNKAYLAAFGRAPSAEERDAALAFLKSRTEQIVKQTAEKAASPTAAQQANAPAKKSDSSLTPEQQALTLLCHALVSSNQFIYVD